jgi:hypothetical protein
MGTRDAKKETSAFGELIETHPSNPYEAKICMRAGQEAPIANYLHDVAETLGLLADQLDPSDQKSGWQVKPRTNKKGPKTSSRIGHDEWVSDTAIAQECIRMCNAVLTGWYLRDIASFVRALARHSDPDGRTEMRLTFGRRRRGRPKTPKKMYRDSKITLGLLGLRHEMRKNAVPAVAETQRVSRSTVYRAGRPKKRRDPNSRI